MATLCLSSAIFSLVITITTCEIFQYLLPGAIRYLDKSLKNDFDFKTIGLIETNWYGTRIEPWMTPEGLKNCNIPPNIDDEHPENSWSYLYNAMIHPLRRLSIYGGLWYQGMYIFKKYILHYYKRYWYHFR